MASDRLHSSGEDVKHPFHKAKLRLRRGRITISFTSTSAGGSAVMTARYTGEIPLDKVQEAFSKMELENIEVIGKRPRCTGSRLVVYNQQTRGMSGRRTMAV
jgi:hypothetical protein